MGHPRLPVSLRVLPPRRAGGVRQGADAGLRRDGRAHRLPLGHLLLRLRRADDPGGRPPGPAGRPVGGGRRRPGDGGGDLPHGARAGLGPLVRRPVPRRRRRLRHVRRGAQDRGGVVSALVLRHALRRDGRNGGAGRAGGHGAGRLARDPSRLARGAGGRRDRHAGRRRPLSGARSGRASRASRRRGPRRPGGPRSSRGWGGYWAIPTPGRPSSRSSSSTRRRTTSSSGSSPASATSTASA